MENKLAYKSVLSTTSTIISLIANENYSYKDRYNNSYNKSNNNINNNHSNTDSNDSMISTNNIIYSNPHGNNWYRRYELLHGLVDGTEVANKIPFECNLGL